MAQIKVTLPDALMASLEKLAEENCRTPEGQIAWLVKSAVDAARFRLRPSAEERVSRNEPLFRELNELHLRRGLPSLREIERRAWDGHQRTISHTTIHEVLKGRHVPGWTVLETIVLALDGDTETFRAVWTEVNR